MHGLHSMLDIKRYNNVGVDSEFSSKIIYIYISLERLVVIYSTVYINLVLPNILGRLYTGS